MKTSTAAGFESLPVSPQPRVFHRGPGQSSTQIFAAHMHFGAQPATWANYGQWSISLTLSGSCQWQTESGTFVVREGDLLLVRSGTPAQWRVEADISLPRNGEPSVADAHWEVVYAVFEPRVHWHEWLAYEEMPPGITLLHLDDATLRAQVRHGLLEMHSLYRQGRPGRDAWTLLALERVLLTLHLHQAQQKGALDGRLVMAAQFMQEHYAEPLTLAQVARAAHLGVTRFSTLFTAQMGLAPMQYLEQVRLGHADELLRFGALSLTQVAEACGFREQEYYARRFKRATGQTPREFRRAASYEAEFKGR